MKKRFFAAFVLVATLFAMSGCSSSGSQQRNDPPPIFAESVSISIMLPRGDEIFNPDWVVWDYIESSTGAKLDLQPATANYEAALATAFASPETIPDLVVFNSKPLSDKYAAAGQLIALEDVLDGMPNWALFWSNIGKDERDKLFQIRCAADGKTYWPARYGFFEFSNIKTWMYRRDIFDQHGLDIPATYDELYDVAKRLKELYPDSYPISCENFFSHVARAAGPQWKPNFECWEYYDFSEGKWRYGAAEDTMLDIIKVFNRLYEDDLIPPNFTASTKHEFFDLVTSGRTFIFPHFQSHMGDFISEARIINRAFDLAVMTPPIADELTGKPLMINSRLDSDGLSIVNTGDPTRISNAIKLFDWFYSNQAYELLSWGKQGETFELSSGMKSFLLPAGEDIRTKYGFQTYAAAQAVYPEAVMSEQFKYNSVEDIRCLLSSIESDYNPRNWISFTADEQKIISEIGAAIRSYARETICKFLLGEKPFSEWDAFVEDLYDMGLDKLLSVYESAYNRVK